MVNMNTNERDEIDATAADWRPSSADIRNEIRNAVETAAQKHGGLVHIADVREHLPAWVTGPRVGANICALVRKGLLVHTDIIRPNGNARTRNRTRPSGVYRYAGATPREN